MEVFCSFEVIKGQWKCSGYQSPVGRRTENSLPSTDGPEGVLCESSQTPTPNLDVLV